MALISFALFLINAVGAVLPYENVLLQIFAQSFFMALGLAVTSSLPNALLSDIVDYDELHHGTRREAMFVMIDHRIALAAGIIFNTVPPLLLDAVGYKNNGGCECGCGVPCSAPYLRWVCPSDVGYACSSAPAASNHLLLGPPDRHAPCTEQPPSVHMVIKVFVFWLPAILLLIATASTVFAPIDAQMTRQIREQAELYAAGQPSIDPLTREMMPRRSSAYDELATFLRHLSSYELSRFHKAGWGSWLLRRMSMRVMLALGCLCALGWLRATNAFFQSDALLSASTLAATGLILFMWWELLRLRTAWARHTWLDSTDKLQSQAELLALSAVMTRSKRRIFGLSGGSIAARLHARLAVWWETRQHWQGEGKAPSDLFMAISEESINIATDIFVDKHIRAKARWRRASMSVVLVRKLTGSSIGGDSFRSLVREQTASSLGVKTPGAASEEATTSAAPTLASTAAPSLRHHAIASYSPPTDADLGFEIGDVLLVDLNSGRVPSGDTAQLSATNLTSGESGLVPDPSLNLYAAEGERATMVAPFAAAAAGELTVAEGGVLTLLTCNAHGYIPDGWALCALDQPPDQTSTARPLVGFVPMGYIFKHPANKKGFPKQASAPSAVCGMPRGGDVSLHSSGAVSG